MPANAGAVPRATFSDLSKLTELFGHLIHL